jgi:hypothetical protein
MEPVLRLPVAPCSRWSVLWRSRPLEGLRWQGGVYAGPFGELQGDAHGSWSLVEQVPLERYLEGVLPHEIERGPRPRPGGPGRAGPPPWSLRNGHRYAQTGIALRRPPSARCTATPVRLGRRCETPSGAPAVGSGCAGPAQYRGDHASNGGVAAVWTRPGRSPPSLTCAPGLDGLDRLGRAGPRDPRAPMRGAAAAHDPGVSSAPTIPCFAGAARLEGQQIAAALARQGLPAGSRCSG